MVDLFTYMNELNFKLMEKGTFAYEMYTVVKTERLKLKIFSCYLSKTNLTNFATLANTKQSVIVS